MHSSRKSYFSATKWSISPMYATRARSARSSSTANGARSPCSPSSSMGMAASASMQDHQRAAEQRHRATGGLVGDDRVPHVGLAAEVHRRALAAHPLADPSRREEVALELDRREARTLRDVPAAPDGGAR